MPFQVIRCNANLWNIGNSLLPHVPGNTCPPC